MGTEYTPPQAAQLIRSGGVQLVDVRAAREHEAGHIADSRLIELGDLPSELPTLDRSRPVILYCYSGGRSAAATQALERAGFDAHNLTGGMLAWRAAGLPIEPPGGCVADP